MMSILSLLRRIRASAYLKVYRNRFWLRDLHTGNTVEGVSEKSFSTSRLIVGDFVVAEALLRKLYKQLYSSRLLLPQARVVTQVMELNEGGLCAVEMRVLRELIEGARGGAAYFHQGQELDDAAAMELLRKREDAA